MKLLSLFSGIGAFEKALDNIQIEYELVNFCEFDKYAVKSYCAIHNEKESKNLGDITKVDEKQLPKDIDLITYGFPCQDISLAGKQKGLFNEDGSQTRSGLFFEALRIIEATKPKVCIAENVKNLVSKKFNAQFQVVLSSLESAGYNNYYKLLNSKDYGIPQNRERVFIVSIRKDIDNGCFDFPEPFILTKKLKDYLEDEVDEKYFLSEKMINYIMQKGTKTFRNTDCRINLDVARPLTTDQNKRAGTTNYICKDLPEDFDLQEFILIKEATKKGYKEACEGDGVYIDRPHQKRGVVQKGMIQTLKTSGNNVGVVVKVLDGYNGKLEIRKLTPKECFRLMGFYDEDFEKAEAVNSNTQLYKQAGNSIVVNVLEELFKKLYK